MASEIKSSDSSADAAAFAGQQLAGARAPSCQSCKHNELIKVVDFGPQPISNRFLPLASTAESLFPLTLVQCRACGLAQLGRLAPAAELTSPYPWLTYNEPEGHLDQLVSEVVKLPGLGMDSGIWGLSFKDDTVLERFRARGFNCTYRFDLAADLHVTTPGAGVEMVQEQMRPANVASFLGDRDRPRVIVARHILEHAHDLHQFLEAMRKLLSPGGYLVVEVPDCEPAISMLDFTTLWEEHVCYFTRATFLRTFANAGLDVISLAVYPYRLENLLVAVVRVGDPRAGLESGDASPPDAGARHFTTAVTSCEVDLAMLQGFAEGLSVQRRRFAEVLDQYRRKGPVAVLGAGHLACAFIQYLRLQEYIAMVVDDNPRKQGLLMPGSRIPIRAAAALKDDNVSLCLLSVNPEVEEKVIERNRAFLDRGGRFASIFMTSNRRLI